MKTNLKLSKITISKLDNLNLKPLRDEELKNIQGGDPDLPTVWPTTHGHDYNDTTHLSSCQLDWDSNGNYTECISRDS